MWEAERAQLDLSQGGRAQLQEMFLSCALTCSLVPTGLSDSSLLKGEREWGREGRQENHELLGVLSS